MWGGYLTLILRECVGGGVPYLQNKNMQYEKKKNFFFFFSPEGVSGKMGLVLYSGQYSIYYSVYYCPV